MKLTISPICEDFMIFQFRVIETRLESSSYSPRCVEKAAFGEQRILLANPPAVEMM